MQLEDSCNPAYYANATGNITASLGGLTQVKPTTDSLMANKTLDESVEFGDAGGFKIGY